jgi:hypothetical protein
MNRVSKEGASKFEHPALLDFSYEKNALAELPGE